MTVLICLVIAAIVTTVVGIAIALHVVEQLIR